MEVAVLDRLAQRAVIVLMSLFFAIMLISASVAGYRTLNSLSGVSNGSDPGWWISAGIEDARIVSVRKDGPAAGSIYEGDRIVALNGRKVLNPRELTRAFEQIPPGSSYDIVVDRGGLALAFRSPPWSFPPSFSLAGLFFSH